MTLSEQVMELEERHQKTLKSRGRLLRERNWLKARILEIENDARMLHARSFHTWQNDVDSVLSENRTVASTILRKIEKAKNPPESVLDCILRLRKVGEVA